MIDEEFQAYIEKHIYEQPQQLPYYSNRRCPDQIIGYVKFSKEAEASGRLWLAKKERQEHQAYIEQFAAIQQAIVLIIESPHKDEFADTAFVAPALGKTGEYLQRYLPDLLKQIGFSLPIEGKYTIVLANTIQHQCSLGELPKKYRDQVWGNLWPLEQTAFLERITAYQPRILIEMCTSSDGRKVKVRQALKTRFQDLPIFETYHPSSWWQDANRRMRTVQ